MNIGSVLFNESEIYQIVEKEEFILNIQEPVQVLFVAPNLEDELFTEEYRVLIQNIFNALKRSDIQFELVLLKHTIALTDLFKYPSIHYFIFFGKAEKLVDFQFEFIRNRPIKLSDKKILFTDSLPVLGNPINKAQKNEFWAGLQRMFA